MALALAMRTMMLAPQVTAAQDASERVVTVMHAAPGKYMDLVKFLVEVDTIRAEAKLEPRQIYRHHNGATWDFLVIELPLVANKEDWYRAAAKKLGIKPMPGEFRMLVIDHEDTVVGGPTTAAAILAEMTP